MLFQCQALCQELMWYRISSPQLHAIATVMAPVGHGDTTVRRPDTSSIHSREPWHQTLHGICFISSVPAWRYWVGKLMDRGMACWVKCKIMKIKSSFHWHEPGTMYQTDWWMLRLKKSLWSPPLFRILLSVLSVRLGQLRSAKIKWKNSRN
jgi:hypothetical protein